MNQLLIMHMKNLYKSSRLPSDYIECEYIENTSEAYIDTGIKPDLNTETTIEFQLSTNPSTTQFIFGSRNSEESAGEASYSCGITPTPEIFTDTNSWLNRNSFAISSLTSKFIVKKGNKFFNLNSINYSIPYELTSKSTCSLCLFGVNSGNSILKFCTMRIFSCYIKNIKQNKLNRNYIPCLQVSSGKFGLYDFVSKQFFSSPNNKLFRGKLLNKIKGYTPLSYIQNNTNGYINTEILPENSLKILTIFDHNISPNSFQTVLGSKSSTSNIGRFGLHINMNMDSQYALAINEVEPIYKVSPGSFHSFKYYPPNIYVDSTSLPNSSQKFKGEYPIWLFGFNADNTLVNPCNSAKIFLCLIWNNKNKLLRYLIPCKQNSTNEVGLYDKVSKQFFTSPNGVKFIGD